MHRLHRLRVAGNTRGPDFRAKGSEPVDADRLAFYEGVFDHLEDVVDKPTSAGSCQAVLGGKPIDDVITIHFLLSLSNRDVEKAGTRQGNRTPARLLMQRQT